MFRTALMMFVFGGMMAWAQAQDTTPAPTDKVPAQDTTPASTDNVDRASAYYHYALAQYYSDMSLAPGGNKQVYLDKAKENYEEAVKADPQVPRPVITPFHMVITLAPKPLPPVLKPSPSSEQK